MCVHDWKNLDKDILLRWGEQSGEPGMVAKREKYAGFMFSYAFRLSARSDAQYTARRALSPELTRRHPGAFNVSTLRRH
jgi:hypothetical protein